METLHVVPAPRFAGQRVYDCRRCSAEDLLHPVFLSDGNAYGTRCAAIKLGLIAESGTLGSARRAIKAELEKLAAAERLEANRRQTAADAPWFAWCEQFGGVAEANRHHGGFLAAREAFRASR